MSIMNISAINGLEEVSRYSTTNPITSTEKEDSFDTLLNSAMGMIQETNSLSNAAEVEKIKYAMGESDSLHDLQIAQQKASVALQYTVAVKNTAVEAYRSIMNMQF